MMELTTVSVPEAARILGIGRNVAFRLANDGTIPALRLGKKLRVPVAALEKMLETGNTNTKEAGR